MSSNPASAGLSVKAMMEDHVRMTGEIQAAQVRILEATLARQRETVAGGWCRMGISTRCSAA